MRKSRITQEILDDLHNLSRDEFIDKHKIPIATYYKWKKKINNNEIKNNITEKKENEEEFVKGKIEDIPQIKENKPILDLDKDAEINTNSSNTPELVKTFCEIIYKGALELIKIFFKKRYKGDIDKFIEKIIPYWQRQLDKWNINLANMDTIMFIAMHIEIILNLEDIEEPKPKEEVKIENDNKINDNKIPASEDKYNIEDFFKINYIS